MSEYDPHAVEERWRDRWQEEGTYEADPDEAGEPTFVTVPYPYPSGGMHIGHARTYTVPDVYARYRRLQGDNVLFPIAWHVTGTPIIGAVERLKKGEEKQLSVLRDTYNVPEDTLQDLETPMGFARYFIEEHYKKGMRSLGLSIDWRREFTTNDERYQRFITWQYETLRDRGLLEKGLHPVKYCTNEQQPVTTHDILEGEEAEFQEYTLVKFTVTLPDGDTAVAPMATLRPETVRGVTNAFVKPSGSYVKASVDGETWVVSETAAEKLRLQERTVEVLDTFEGEELVGVEATNPITEDEVVVLPASFVDPENATGVVMSVPAHSPDDYVALQEVKDDADSLAEYGIDPDAVRALEPIPILTIEGYGEIPAKDAVEQAGVTSQDDPALEAATQELYNREFHQGELIDAYGEYAGRVVEDVREAFRDHYRRTGQFGQFYEFTEEVVCRCGGAVEVAKQDTWFLRYNDEDWKAETKRAIDRLTAIPENTREQYTHTVDWLNEWPCIRNYGLGTRLPWDQDFVIEPLSDSTIYMAYYTIAHRLDDVPPEGMTREFFDTLFYGADAVDDPDEHALDLREEWDHWYPVDVRVSANDLISNHLTFFLYHHAELFDEDNWPEGITIMGMGLLEGQKMSSSKGHVVLPGEAVSEYGADTARFFLLNSAEPWQDFDWRADQVETVHDQLRRFWDRAARIIESEAPEDPDLRPIDEWLLSRLQTTVREATEALDGFETRTASQAAFYAFEESLRWYRRRTDLDRPGARYTQREVLRTRLELLAPFVPFMANELHERLTGEPAEEWPEVDESLESAAVEARETLVRDLTDDVNDIVDVVGSDPEVIRVYAAADWKRDVLEQVVETGPDVGAVMGEVMSDPDLREKGNAVNQLVQDLVEVVRERDADTLADLRALDEVEVYEDAAAFLEREFGADVEVYAEDDPDAVDPEGKAGNAQPLRPAIHLE
ncbi:leucine--tRNA ligase [Salinirubellus salinus]|uniref:Leucine--tRNA ligase n=1 Tax=Salinirubellus salinus TaxID=1364945 RepID=A0A9E7U743_9EURY|nr:leucine--tRNA ligase [Salinirubellus salinus]UWM53146.1 leucine--tRNA ligase [Salinirubellus salinus]